MSEAEGTPPKPPATSAGGGKWSLTRIVTSATGLVGLAAATVALLFRLDPAAEPCLGGSSARFVDVPVFPMTAKEYGYISSQMSKYAGGHLGAEVRATVEVDNMRGSQVRLYYTLLEAGARGAADEVVSGADEFGTRTQTADSCNWRGGFDLFILPQPTPTNLTVSGLDATRSYQIVLELFKGDTRDADGANRIALFETPPFRG